MFQKLKDKWKVSWIQFALVISTFAIGGSLCGFVSKKILNTLFNDRGFIYYVVYILLMTAIWPLCVLTVSIFLGQFRFFKNYLLRIYKKITKQSND